MGSGFLMVCPPTREHLASLTMSAPPRKIWEICSLVILSSGMPAMAIAVMGRPPMAYTSDNEFAAAIWPKR